MSNDIFKSVQINTKHLLYIYCNYCMDAVHLIVANFLHD